MVDEESGTILNKLGILPKYELVHLVKKIYKNDKQGLINIIYLVTSKKIREPFNKINNFNAETLLGLLSETKDLPIDLIDELYYEYNQTKNPSLYFFEILDFKESNFLKSGDKDKEKYFIDKINYINPTLVLKSRPQFKNFSLGSIHTKSNIIEIELDFQSRIDYVDPKTKLPKHIYSLHEGIIWISKDHKSIVIKVDSSDVNKILVKILQNLLESKVVKFNLTKEIVNEIFPFETLRRAGYIEPELGGKKFTERKTLADRHYSDKDESKETDERCDRLYSYHKISLNELEVGTAVSEKGKITLNRHIKRSELKLWSLTLIKDIIRHMSHLKKEQMSKYLNGIDKDSIIELDELTTSTAKENLCHIAVAVSSLKESNEAQIQTNLTSLELFNTLSEYLIPIFEPSCVDCGENSYTCNNCGELNSAVIRKGSIKIKCDGCQKEINNLAEDIKCPNDSNHKIDGTIEENVSFFSTKKLFELLNKLSRVLEMGLNLTEMEILKIKNRIIYYKLSNNKTLYLMDMLPSFASITKIDKIPTNVLTTQLINLKYAKEKCNVYSDVNCRDCIISQKGLCIQRLVGSFTKNTRLHSHCGTEFGDISFVENVDGNNITLVGLAKSDLKVYDKMLTLRNGKGSNLFAQAYDALADSRINFIAIIATAILHEKLRESLIQITKWNNKRITFIEKPELVRMVYDYIEKINQGNSNYHFWEIV
ncbi:hypothetical protein HYT53_04545 [Candidatus Woesearchaeota archaeon]|nr:hypothetical protein [Candidatus Woesearchaeota archaeon]